MAVVKADGYGHGAVAAAYAALESGATWLGVALVEEGVELRDAGIEAPILLLSQPPAEAARAVVDAGLTPVVYSRPLRRRPGQGRGRRRRVDPQPVHLKVDTGMHRVGCVAERGRSTWPRRSSSTGNCTSQGLLTHFAVADEPDNPYTARQVATFEAVRKELARSGIRPPLVHAANSAGRPDRARGPLRPGPLRHLDLRHRPRRPAGGAGRRSSPALSASRPGSATSATSWPASVCPTACATSSTSARPWSRCPSATPTACPAAWARSAARS